MAPYPGLTWKDADCNLEIFLFSRLSGMHDKWILSFVLKSQNQDSKELR